MKKFIVKFDSNYSVRYEIVMQDEKLTLREYAICPYDRNVLSSNKYITLYCIDYSDDDVTCYTCGHFKKQQLSDVFFKHINDRVNISNFKIPKISGSLEIQFLDENISPRFTIDTDLISSFIYYTHAVKNFTFLEMVEGLSEEDMLSCRFKYKNMPDKFLSALKEFKLLLLEKSQQIENIFHYKKKEKTSEEFIATSSESSSSTATDNSQSYSFFRPSTSAMDGIVGFAEFASKAQRQEECLIL